MTERMVLYLGENLDWIEQHGIPEFVSSRYYVLGKLPAKERFVSGDVLVWSQRSNTRYIYLGELKNVQVDRLKRQLQFTKFERFDRPVVIRDGANGDFRKKFYDLTKDFLNDFSYISERAYDNVLTASRRPPPRRRES